jgi:glycosyltransferase involved in cell wall biosynthesis
LRKRILFCNEASFLATGFSTYGLEVIKRLHSTDKYDIAELGIYGHDDDNRRFNVPWRFYPNAPSTTNEEALRKYYEVNTYQFGEFRFEQTCIDFRPDIVVDWRDWWFLEHQERSPFRPFFHWTLMPTIDAEPQDEQWLGTFINADGVFTYSDWGANVLRKQGGKNINLQGTAPPGVNLDEFELITQKGPHKQSVGIAPTALIIGTVMRNQKRKLYPDLIEAFAKFLKTAPADLAERTFLYLHTTYPDVGWNLPRLIKEQGITRKVIFTYMCDNCKAVFPSLYQDIKSTCRNCGQNTISLPGVRAGISRKSLGSILNLFDIYVQYSTCEGFGMPQIEAAAAGVPVMAVDYSAMSDIIQKLGEGGIPIKVQRYFRESETHCYRALPDNDDLIEKWIDILSQPEIMRIRMGMEGRKAVAHHYNWDSTAMKWERYFDNTAVRAHEQTWLSPIRTHQPVMQLPDNMPNEDFIKWAIVNIAGRPELLNSFIALRLVRDLTWGASQVGPGGIYLNEASLLGMQVRWNTNYDRFAVARELHALCEEKNYWEQQRIGGLK